MPWACSLQQGCTASVSSHEGLSSSVGMVVLGPSTMALYGDCPQHYSSDKLGAWDIAAHNKLTSTHSPCLTRTLSLRCSDDGLQRWRKARRSP